MTATRSAPLSSKAAISRRAKLRAAAARVRGSLSPEFKQLGADEITRASWADWLKAEDGLFAEVKAEVSDKLPEADCTLANPSAIGQHALTSVHRSKGDFCWLWCVPQRSVSCRVRSLRALRKGRFKGMPKVGVPFFMV